MNFRTQIPLKKQQFNLLDYNSKIFLIGSCFSENIGSKLAYYKFQSEVNPFGILFHPKAIEQFIIDVVNEREFTEEDIFFNNERWHSFDAHSSLSSVDKNELLKNLNNAISTTFTQLNNSTHIIITLGTSWVYREIASDKIVANCHKVPQRKFLKEILSVDEISESLDSVYSLIKTVNKNLLIVFTVSPIRHTKDGFVENQRSKSHLLSAIHQFIKINSLDTYQTYFPSYEIMMDELRDYRFYAKDMIHPNQTAINYIWEQFCKVWLHSSAEKTMQEVEAIQKGLTHKPFNINSEKHQQFLGNLQEKKVALQKANPNIKF